MVSFKNSSQWLSHFKSSTPLLTDQDISLLPKARREDWFSRLVDRDLLCDPSLFMGQCNLFNFKMQSCFPSHLGQPRVTPLEE